jgi:exopolysaccharide/PEP-CTERM locus tyrosine autokinase
MSFIETSLRKARAAAAAAASASAKPTSPELPSKSDPTRGLPGLPQTAPGAPPRERRAPSSPPLVLDAEKLRKIGLLPGEADGWRLRDQYRVIKRQLLRSLADQPPLRLGNLIMVTSSLPEEGKTYTTFNLGVSIARERDYSVMLVDADLAKCGLTSELGLRDRPGLIDLLKNEQLALEDVIVPTTIPGLKVIPSGESDDIAAELLASSVMGKRAAELHSSYADHIVLFDSGPLLIASEAPVLADAVGQIAMVVHAGTTLQDSVTDALSKINREIPIGLILNGWEPVALSEQEYYGKHSEYGTANSARAARKRAQRSEL